MSLRVMKKYGSVILGTDKFQGASCKNMIKAALIAGYRIVDTAQAYGNEEVIGQAIQETTTVHRDDLFLITKISSGWKKNPQSVAEAYESAQKSLDRLGVPYMDLFLIHSPGEDAGARRATWQGLEQLRIEGLTKYIGVSNYDVTHLAEMATYSTIGPPAVNQIEVSKFP
jgi:diketogulonate reductase-like aldo/keto reductase